MGYYLKSDLRKTPYCAPGFSVLLLLSLASLCCSCESNWGPDFQAELEAIAAQGRPQDIRTIAQYLDDLTELQWPRVLCRFPDTKSEVAIHVLSTMDNPEVVDCLLPLLKSDRLATQFAAVEAVGRWKKHPSVKAHLAEVILDPDENKVLKEQVAEILGRMDEKECFPILVNALAKEDDKFFHSKDGKFVHSSVWQSLTLLTGHEPPLDSFTTAASAAEFWWNWWEENKSYNSVEWKIRGFKKEFQALPKLGHDNFIPLLIDAVQESDRRSAIHAFRTIMAAIAPDAQGPYLDDYEKWYEENKELMVWDNNLRQYKVDRARD